MDRSSMENLRLDRRLMHRRGWLSKAELEAELEKLPDVSGKAASPEDEESPAAAGPASDTGSAADRAAPPRVE